VVTGGRPRAGVLCVKTLVGAVLAAQSGATLKELMARMGHTSPAMSMRYQHVAAGRDVQIAAAMSALASGGSE